MNPFYFGDKSRQLYGVLHPAEGASFRDEAVVLCYPYGQEYERAHRAFKILANNLSNLGYEVLRFDYAGTGDSWGDSDDISMAEWQADIRQAVAEAKDTAGVDRVSLIGLRLGATLALMAADRIEGLHRVVCWDPVVDGES
ncbi:MAG: alpha/beta hydrolase, partial [Ketobacteraceae bacterium]|nr:alpha/beta hydrolase [Ketobacteraceae bacterium]